MTAPSSGESTNFRFLLMRACSPRQKGAETTLFLATIADATPFNGGYVVSKVLERPDPAALDDSFARRLWDESARLVGP